MVSAEKPGNIVSRFPPVSQTLGDKAVAISHNPVSREFAWLLVGRAVINSYR
jgi:hypothetical protein